jgi:hypothetical protein
MTRLLPRIALLLALLPLLAPPARSDEDAAPEAAPKTVEVARRPFTETVEVTGSFVPRQAIEVAYEPEVYGGPLKVVTAVAPGLVVVGQELVRFDDEKITDDIRDGERDLFIARARLEKQTSEVEFQKTQREMQHERLETALARSEQALGLFLEVDKPTRIAQSVHNLEGAEFRILDQVEELQQLERMYEADDLTEETEEIVIRRARRGLARTRKSFEWQKERHQRFLEVTLPREEHDLKVDVEKKRVDLRSWLATSGPDRRRVEIELEKARTAFERQEKRMRELRADRDALRVRAPADGYAVPGSFQGTAWKELDGMRRTLVPDGQAKPRQVLFTIVHPGNVGVLTAVGEAEVLGVRSGLKAVVRPGVKPDLALDAAVVEVLRVGTGGKYGVSIDLAQTDPGLMPGQTCKIEIVTRRVESALVVPAAAVRKDGERHLVHRVRDGQVEDREVQVGATSGEHIEILGGVEEGDRILAKAPKPKDAK